LTKSSITCDCVILSLHGPSTPGRTAVIANLYNLNNAAAGFK
jgi:hypothetical protein